MTGFAGIVGGSRGRSVSSKREELLPLAVSVRVATVSVRAAGVRRAPVEYGKESSLLTDMLAGPFLAALTLSSRPSWRSVDCKHNKNELQDCATLQAK